jgi:hypothetical protein
MMKSSGEIEEREREREREERKGVRRQGDQMSSREKSPKM